MDMDGAPLPMEGLEGGGVMIVGNEVVLDNVVVGTLAAAGSSQMTTDENLLAGAGLATTEHFLLLFVGKTNQFV